MILQRFQVQMMPPVSEPAPPPLSALPHIPHTAPPRGAERVHSVNETKTNADTGFRWLSRTETIKYQTSSKSYLLVRLCGKFTELWRKCLKTTQIIRKKCKEFECTCLGLISGRCRITDRSKSRTETFWVELEVWPELHGKTNPLEQGIIFLSFQIFFLPPSPKSMHCY